MAPTEYFQIRRLSDQFIGQELVLGVLPDNELPRVLVTDGQRRRLGVGDLPFDTIRPDRYISLSPITFANAEEFHAMVVSPSLKKNKKKQWWEQFTKTKNRWATFEHSRALYSIFKGTEHSVFNVNPNLSRARFYTFVCNIARLPGLAKNYVDMAYSEFSVNGLELISTQRYVLSRSKSAPIREQDATELVTPNDREQRLREFLRPCSANQPFVIIVYDFDDAMDCFNLNQDEAVIEDGIETFFYPLKRNYNRRPSTAGTNPENRPRRLSNLPHVHFIDVKYMTETASPYKPLIVGIHADADRFGVTASESVSGKLQDAAIDSRVLLELWCQMAKGNHMRAQQAERQAPNIVQPGNAQSSASAPLNEDEPEDPNDAEVMKPAEPVKRAVNEPYQYSDDDD